MRTKLIQITALAAYLCLSGSCFAEEKIEIGVSTALTRNAATYGVDAKNALQFANERFPLMLAGIFGSIIPFGPFVVDRWLSRIET